MIKRYLDFIKESQINGFNSLGEWVESLMNDEYVRNIIARYTKDSDASINLSNAINILDDNTKDEIKYQIDNYLQNGIEEKEPEFLVSTDLEELTEALDGEITIAGKGIFTSFLKALTSLGQKELGPNWSKCPDDFLLYYYYPNLQSEIIKQVFSRFKSLSRYLDLFDYQKNEVDLYFGIKCDGNFEYGLHYDTPTPIGQFKLNQSVIKWICQIESKSAHSLKKELVNLTLADVITLGKIKLDMKEFNPGYHESKDVVKIQDKIISFGYKGLGKWDNGKFDEGEFMNIKNNFTTWVMTKRWGGKVLISVKPTSYYVYIHIKLK
jgi:hypothetical protein